MSLDGTFESYGKALPDAETKLYVEWNATQNQNNATSKITCKVYFTYTGKAYYYTAPVGKCTAVIDGTTYTVDTAEISRTKESHLLIATITSGDIDTSNVDEYTDIDISITWEVDSLNYYTTVISIIKYTSETKKTASDTVSITPVYRTTLLPDTAITGAILGEVSTIDVVNNKRYSNATHSLSYRYTGSTNVFEDELFAKQSGDYIDFTIPEELIKDNTTGRYISVRLTLTTHFPNGASGTDSTYILYSPSPDSATMKPSCTIEITDGSHIDNVPLFEKYGGFIQSKSRFNIVVKPILAYDSPINTCTIVANGETYTELEAETALIKNAGNNKISVFLTDKRGYSSGELSFFADVLEYVKPSVSDVRIIRCDEFGEATSTGKYIKIVFSAGITPLNNLNSASYELTYQTLSGLDQNDKTLTKFYGDYSIVNGVTDPYPAKDGAVYSAKITAKDDLDEDSKFSGASENTTLINFLGKGLGISFGTLATLANVFENAFKFFPTGGFMFPELQADTLSALLTPNIYTVANAQDVNGSPTDSEYTLIVLPGGGEGDLLYIAISTDPAIYIKRLVNSSWSGWYTIGLTEMD